MTGRLLALAVIAILLGARPSLAQDEAAALAQTANGFYGVALELDQSGIPDAKTRARLRPYISPVLEQLLAQGAQAEKGYAVATKGESPPLLEGDIFTSLFEGASTFKVGACQIHGAKGECEIALTYTGGDGKPEHWTDTAVLVEAPDGWRLDDIDYGGNWPFSNKGTLKGNLTFAIQNATGE